MSTSQSLQSPTPTKRRSRGQKLLLLAAAVGLVLAVVASLGSNEPSSVPSADNNNTISRGLGAKDATKDVRIVSFIRGTNEFSMAEVKLEITNHSSGTSDYYVELSLTDKEGTNVGFTNALAQHVLPGQKAVVTAPVIEDTASTATVTEVQRTASS